MAAAVEQGGIIVERNDLAFDEGPVVLHVHALGVGIAVVETGSRETDVRIVQDLRLEDLRTGGDNLIQVVVSQADVLVEEGSHLGHEHRRMAVADGHVAQHNGRSRHWILTAPAARQNRDRPEAARTSDRGPCRCRRSGPAA